MNVNSANILQILQGQAKAKGSNTPVDGEMQAAIDSLMSENPEISKNTEDMDFASLLSGEEESTESAKDILLQNPEVKEAGTDKKLVSQLMNPEKTSSNTVELKQVNLPKEAAVVDTQKATLQPKLIGKDQVSGLQPEVETKVANLQGKSAYFSNPVKKLFKPKAEKTAVKEIETGKKSNLLDLNEFISKQSPASQKRSVASAYKPMSTSMFNKKVEASLPGVVKSPELNLNKQSVDQVVSDESVLELNDTQNSFHTPHKLELGAKAVQQQTPVFDLNQLSDNVNTREEVLGKVQDYLVQAKVGSEKQVEFSFQHKELGQVDLMVQKAQGDQLNIAIHSHSNEGVKFFTKHQGELLQSLSQNGVSVSDFKLDTANTSNSSSQFGQDSGKGQFAGGQKHQQFGSESGQRQHDSEKRQQLWNQFYDKEVA